MPLQTRWLPLTRATAGRAPDSYGVYELGDDDGNVLAVETGVLRDELKEVLAYGDAAKVRWKMTHTPEQAEKLAEEHRDRL